MAGIAVFASGRGTNFSAIADALRPTRHRLEFLLCDRAGAPVVERALKVGIPRFEVSWVGEKREAVEKKIVRHLERRAVDVVALAGFMRLLSPWFLDAFKGPVINVHPSLLPRHPGMHGIEESFKSGDSELGITIMRIDAGVDTGPAIVQKSFPRDPSDTLEEVEARIHALEHEWYPRVLLSMLDGIDAGGSP
jgi:phosphoribosylglycinamide formyltransferase-1